MLSLHYLVGLAGVWALGNGILHDVFVLQQRKPYDKELIRLLIDGHILIFSGILYLLCVAGVQDHQPLAVLVTATVAGFLTGYCIFIFKILRSYLTLLINLAVLLWSIREYFL